MNCFNFTSFDVIAWSYFLKTKLARQLKKGRLKRNYTECIYHFSTVLFSLNSKYCLFCFV